MLKIMESAEDASVNFIENTKNGFIESRFVQRNPEYFIVYLSSQSGCRQACRFCHLTATGQTSEENVTPDGYIKQAERVLLHASIKAQKANKVHYNFMARGEPLVNPFFIANSNEIFDRLGLLRPDLENRFLVSTIMPETFQDNLKTVFKDQRSTIYYSLYSMKPEFRRRWLPRAMDPNIALDMLADYQAETGHRIALHWAFIEGQNDSEEDVDLILDAVRRRGIKAKFNLVRYNPFGIRQGVEPQEDKIKILFDRMNKEMFYPSRIVPRVGFDVKASCGMFV